MSYSRFLVKPLMIVPKRFVPEPLVNHTKYLVTDVPQYIVTDDSKNIIVQD